MHLCIQFRLFHEKLSLWKSVSLFGCCYLLDFNSGSCPGEILLDAATDVETGLVGLLVKPIAKLQ